MDMIEDVSNVIVDTYRPERKVPLDMWDWDSLNNLFQMTFNTKIEINPLVCYSDHNGVIEDYIADTAKGILKDKFSNYDDDHVKDALREILLSIFDHHWKDHLLSMDHVKEGINLRAYAQKNPLTEYKREAFLLFEQMRETIKKSVVENIFNAQLYTKEEIEELKRKQQEHLERQMDAHKRAQEEAQRVANKKPITRGDSKVGRNEPCPCGSGKKFKRCHGA